MTTSENDILKRKAAFISVASRRGWTVVADGDWGIQLKRHKVYQASFFWIGVALLIFGIGVLIWVWGVLDYLMRRDEILLVPVDRFTCDDFAENLKLLL